MRIRHIKYSETGTAQICIIQLTPDNSNLLGKSKKVRVIGSLKKITGIKKVSKWMGGGM